jgi:hypothetical protein
MRRVTNRQWSALIAVIAVALIPRLAEASNAGDFKGGVAIGSSYAGVDTAPTDGLIVQGNVGIGTSSPSQTLEVNGELQIDTSGNGLVVTGASSTNTIGFTLNNTSGHEWIMGSTGSSDSTPNSFQFYDNTSGGYRGSFDGSGRFLIAYTASQNSCCMLQVNGTIGATSTSITSLSDARLKKHIVPLEDGLSVIELLRPVTFEYRVGMKTLKGDKEKFNFPDSEQVGFTYQDVAEAVSDKSYRNAIVTDPEENGSYGMLQEGNLIPILVKAVQQLKAENDRLQDTLSNEQKEIDQLRQAAPVGNP